MNHSNYHCPPGVDDSFGPAVKGCRDNFDFTLTFEQSLLSIAPSALLIVAGCVRLIFLLYRPRKAIEANGFKWIKVGTLAVFAALQLALVVMWAQRSHLPTRGTGIGAAVLSFLASILLCLLSPQEHTKSFAPSAIVCSYLFLTVLFDATILRTLWISAFDEQLRRIFTASFTMRVMILFLEAREKRDFVSSNSDKARSPEEFSGIYSKSLYWWLNSLMRRGFKEILGPGELYPLAVDIQAQNLDVRLWAGWNESTSKSSRKISLVLLNVLKWPIVIAVLPRLILLAFTFCQPLLLQRFLDYLQNEEERRNRNNGYRLIGAYSVVYFGIAISSSVYWQLTYQSLTMVRGMLVTSIYNKTTTIEFTALDNAKAVTLMGTDAERIVRGVMDFHELWASIIQVALATWLLADQLGVAAVGPVAVCILAVSATVWAGTITSSRQLAWIAAIEKRIGTTSSVLGTMKSIRLSGLASKVTSIVHSLRLNEITAARRFWFVGAFTSTVGLVPQMLAPVITLAIFTVDGVRKDETLDFTRMFTSLALLNLLTQPLFQLFAGIIEFISAVGSLKRINNYLAADSRIDARKLMIELSSPSERIVDSAVVLQDFSASWSKAEDAKPSLTNINLSIPRSSMTFLVGPVASGKSTLLKAILNEVPVATGTLYVMDKEIAFCDQTPWLINATIRENITAFSTFDTTYYYRTLHACALDNDLKELKHGDQTKIGSKGHALSSGQKQRIALARAVYSRKRIILFDDVLSQLDRLTQDHIFAHVFGPGGLLKESNTTVVLASHAVNFLPLAHQVAALGEDGTIKESGTFEQLHCSGQGYVHRLSVEHKIKHHLELHM